MARPVGVVMGIARSSAQFHPRLWFARFAAAARRLGHDLRDPYRPELHYMRGPGPRWHQKHSLEAAQHAGALTLPSTKAAS